MMNFIKRCFMSLSRNLSRVIPLFLIVFILGNVICGANIIKQSTDYVKFEFQKTFGTKIKIDFNDGYRNKVYLGNTKEFINVDLIFIYLNEYQDYYYSNITYFSNNFVSNNLSYLDLNANELSLYIFGINHSVPIDEKKYDIELVQGRHFTNDELSNGSKVAIISDEFRSKDNQKLNIGDYFEVKSVAYDYNGEIEVIVSQYEVIGIYKRTNSVQNNLNYYSPDNNLSIIYIPLLTLEKEVDDYNVLLKKYKNSLVNLIPIKAYFQLNDVTEFNSFKRKYDEFIATLDVLPTDYYLETSDEIYKRIGQPIESLSNISGFILIASSIVTTVVLMLLIFILLRNRKHEIGLLVSLGERKYKILIQYILEIYLVGVLALSLSLFTGCKLGELFSERMTLTDEKTEEYFNEFNVELSNEYIISVIEIGSIIMVVSVVFPIAYILKLDPKKILM